MTILNLKEAVKKLSPHERILLVQYILDTIVTGAEAIDTEDAIDEKGLHLSDEWKKELDARKAAYDAGHLKSVPWEDLKQRLLGEE